MKTLIHHDGALGDVLLSLPCFHAVRSGASSLHFIGRRDVAVFLERIGLVDAASPSDQAAFASLYATLDAQARRFLGLFDRAFVFSASAQSTVAAGIAVIIPHTRTISTIPPQGARLSAAEYRFAQLCPGVNMPDAPPLQAPPDVRERVTAKIKNSGWDQGRPLVAIHPGSGGREKCWPLEQYLSLADELVGHHGVFVVLFSGPAEEKTVKPRIDRFAFDRNAVLHAAGWQLDHAAALLAQALFYIGNDSGFTHLAAAAGSAVISLFGPTAPLVWKPIGNDVTILSEGFPRPMEAIPPDAVRRHALRLLAARTG